MADSKREPIPPYKRVADALREDIRAKRLLPGEQVSSATELAETHNVSRNTAARALRLLRDEGYLVTQQGWGSFVADPLPRSDG
jgi:DNA-binding GntR family transcriptional regulator